MRMQLYDVGKYRTHIGVEIDGEVVIPYTIERIAPPSEHEMGVGLMHLDDDELPERLHRRENARLDDTKGFFVDWRDEQKLSRNVAQQASRKLIAEA